MRVGVQSHISMLENMQWLIEYNYNYLYGSTEM